MKKQASSSQDSTARKMSSIYMNMMTFPKDKRLDTIFENSQEYQQSYRAKDADLEASADSVATRRNKAKEIDLDEIVLTKESSFRRKARAYSKEITELQEPSEEQASSLHQSGHEAEVESLPHIDQQEDKSPDTLEIVEHNGKVEIEKGDSLPGSDDDVPNSLERNTASQEIQDKRDQGAVNPVYSSRQALYDVTSSLTSLDGLYDGPMHESQNSSRIEMPSLNSLMDHQGTNRVLEGDGSHIQINANPRNEEHGIDLEDPVGQNNGPVEQGGPVVPNQDQLRDTIAINNYKSKFRRLLFVFIAAFIATFFIPGISTEYPSIRALFVTIYAAGAYSFLEFSSRVFAKQIHRWQRTEDVFKALDVVSLMGFFVLLDLYLSIGFQLTKFAALLPFCFGVIYCFSSTAPSKIREPNCVYRILFAVQIILVALKLDGDIDWSWMIILCLTWLYLGLVVIYSVLLALVFMVMMILAVCGRRLYHSIDRKTQNLGHLWHLLYATLGPLITMALIGTIFGLESDLGFGMLKICLQVGRYFSLFLALYLVVFQRYIITFTRTIYKDEELSIVERENLNSDKKPAEIEVEKKVLLLMRVSSTYFLSLRNSLLFKDKEHLKKLKESIKETKEDRQRRDSRRRSSGVNGKLATLEPRSLQELKEDKESLERRLEVFERQGTIYSDNTEAQEKVGRQGSLKSTKKNAVRSHSDIQICIADQSLRCERTMYLSEGDHEEFQEAMQLNGEENSMNNVCYICVENPCNAVMMNCGHGGVCYECALEFARAKSQCMECRQTVERVVKIDPDTKQRNVISYEATKLIHA